MLKGVGTKNPPDCPYRGIFFLWRNACVINMWRVQLPSEVKFFMMTTITLEIVPGLVAVPLVVRGAVVWATDRVDMMRLRVVGKRSFSLPIAMIPLS